MVEVSADAITLRVGPRWLHFTPEAVHSSEAPSEAFELTEEGFVRLGEGVPEEMDVAAERFAREILSHAD